MWLNSALAAGQGAPQARSNLPDADYNWSILALDGRVVPFSEFKGKTVFLNFWATWWMFQAFFRTWRWTGALKRLLDSGTLRDVLVVTTGSRAHDLRRGTKRLPGREGRLPAWVLSMK